MFKLGWDTAQNPQMFGKQGGGTPHIPSERIWSDFQTRVGTPHKILTYFKSKGVHRTFRLRVVWSNVQTRVGTPHKIPGRKA